jgi:anti-sigma factor ChrR (cupin superfamily)
VHKEFKPGHASSESQREPNPFVQSDLQYVSIEVDGTTYGGWYRVLADGHMELLALAKRRVAPRLEIAPVDQALAMLAGLVRSRLGKEEPTSPTLGDVIYADRLKSRLPESDWTDLVAASATGDLSAFNGLFERTHQLVFTLTQLLTHDRTVSEEIALNAFETLWESAHTYDPEDRTVLAWVMNEARSAAVTHPTFTSSSQQRGSRKQVAASRSPERAELLWGKFMQRCVKAADEAPEISSRAWSEPAWEEVAPGITCKLLANDDERERVSMLVRLAPGTDYPPHTHAGLEELHLLEGELWIDENRLYPGDYNRAEAGTSDKRVWSETGCMCVLVTSTRDALA